MKNKYSLLVIPAVALGLLVGCSRKASKTIEEVTAVNTAVDSLSLLELPFPEIPDGINDPAGKAAFAAEHFWDEMDFRDTIRGRSIDFIEQNFVNFITLLSCTPEQSAKRSVARLLDKAQVDSVAYTLIAETADIYLYDPNSPYYSEELYLLFLKQLVENGFMDEAHAEREIWQLESAMKNRPGMKAADFSFITREGKHRSLHSLVYKDRLLLVFYDPDCDSCRETLAGMMADPSIGKEIASGRLSVLAIYAGEDEQLWKRTLQDFPATWMVGMDTGDIAGNDLYVLRALPSIYLLDSHKTVIEKEGTWPRR